MIVCSNKVIYQFIRIERGVKMFQNRYPVERSYLKPKLHKSKDRKSSDGGFSSYCSRLMKHSLITGFPVIAASSSTLRRTVKGIVFLICTAGFFYQTYYFLEMYLAYPTILDINVINPEVIQAPAMTICNRNRLRRKVYCTEFHKKCVWSTSEEIFCKSYPKLCKKPDPNIVLGVPEIRAAANGNRSLALLNLAGQREKDLIGVCSIKGGTQMFSCSNIVLVQATQDGFPNNCYSIRSLWGNPYEAPLNLSVTSKYGILLNMHPEEYMKEKDLVQAYIYIHDPHSIVNPMAEGVTLEAGKKYKVYVRMEYRQSLPPPYKTNCTDYMKMWKENGGYGPITKRGCTDLCKIEAMMTEKTRCVSQSISYPNNNTICDDSDFEPSKEISERCSEQCNDPCDEKVYLTTTELIDDLAVGTCNDPNDENCRYKSVIIQISFSRMMITRFKHEPKFQDVEMFSYIGGYMGMWLGISLVSLFDFLEMLVDVLAYPVMKWKKRRRVMQRIEHMYRKNNFNIYDY